MSDQTGLSDRFQKLQQKFVERCKNELVVLTETASKTVLEPESLSLLARLAHSLAGAGGTFGFTEISKEASGLEDLLTSDSSKDEMQVRRALQALIAAVNRATSERRTFC
jgi:HPt (histidine-containing phosphotransfer) domain-containing protein